MQNKNPLISVIINCYNGEKFLKKSIDSVLNQTYQNWEIIFWDNLSQDNSKKIVKSFSDKRIKYFCTNNFSKLYQARNFAIQKASGEFISFLDADDWWDNKKLEKQIQEALKENCDLVYSNYNIFYESSKRKKIFSKKKLPTGHVTQSLLNIYEVGILTVLVKKDFFKKKEFDSSYDIIGDFDYFINLSKKIKFGCVQEPLAYYRLHKDNLSTERLQKEKSELEEWLVKNKTMKNYSLNGVSLRIQALDIKIELFSGKRVNAIKKIISSKLGFKKIKLFSASILPIKILKKLIF